MILVNNIGDEPNSYWPLKHAEWNGWTPTDLVFPFFFLSWAWPWRSPSVRCSAAPRGQSFCGTCCGAAIALFALGMFLNGFPNHYHLASWRVYGVLQRIAICYVISAILALWSGLAGMDHHHRRLPRRLLDSDAFVPVPDSAFLLTTSRCSIPTATSQPGSTAICWPDTYTRARAIPKAC